MLHLHLFPWNIIAEYINYIACLKYRIVITFIGKCNQFFIFSNGNGNGNGTVCAKMAVDRLKRCVGTILSDNTWLYYMYISHDVAAACSVCLHTTTVCKLELERKNNHTRLSPATPWVVNSSSLCMYRMFVIAVTQVKPYRQALGCLG